MDSSNISIMLNNLNSFTISYGSSNICVLKSIKLRLNTRYVDDGGPNIWINCVYCQPQAVSRFTFIKLVIICICHGILIVLFLNFLGFKLSSLWLTFWILLRIILLQSLSNSIYIHNLFYVSSSKIFRLLAFKW